MTPRLPRHVTVHAVRSSSNLPLLSHRSALDVLLVWSRAGGLHARVHYDSCDRSVGFGLSSVVWCVVLLRATKKTESRRSQDDRLHTVASLGAPPRDVDDSLNLRLPLQCTARSRPITHAILLI